MTVPIRLVIVDDHRLFTHALKLLLRGEPDIEVLGAVETGEEAIEFCRHNTADVALVDIDLPGKDGIGVTADLRAIQPEIRVVIITAFQQPEVIARAVKAGACGYVMKTDVPDTLVGAIRLAMAGNMVIPAGKLGEDGLASKAHPWPPRRDRSEPGQAERTSVQPGSLTDREVQILQAFADGTPTIEIAEDLGISESTVRSHVKSILSKLDAHSKAEAVTKGFRLGLITSEPPG